MFRFLTILFLLLPAVFSGCTAARITQADRQILHTFLKYAKEHRLSALPVNERIPLIALFFTGTPYQSNTLNVSKNELPIINLREFDCVTFVENVMALAYLPDYEEKQEQNFISNIVKIRYRDGLIEDYASRLHYSSDWLYEMQKHHWLTDITRFAGGIPYPKKVNFMSEHYQSYPPLKQDAALRNKIKAIETAINKRTYYYIPKDKINQACNRIKNGDVLLITTNIKGLDTSHVGFALKKDGKTYLLHASSKGKKVMVSETPLQEYMEDISSQSGIMVARTANLPPVEE